MKSRKAAAWNTLDNAAKIFPSTSSPSDPKVFRFACELTEPVDPETLRLALGDTLEVFPLFRSVLRRGLFWYYLERSSFEPRVEEEWRPPCSPIYDSVKKNLLFSVTYYRRRINLEVYHALTDGTGALQFLRMLTYHYLLRRYAEAFGDAAPRMDYDASITERTADSFRKYYAPEKKGKSAPTPVACRTALPRLGEHRIRIIEGVVPVGAMLALAKRHSATLTAFTAAVLMMAIHGEMPIRERKKPVAVSIPVNLRNYFASESARNFFGVFSVAHTFGDDDSLDAILEDISADFKRELDADRLARRMNDLAALEHNAFIRVVPLALKDLILRYFNWKNGRGETTSLSNLGKIDMPPECAPYIDRFDVFISARRIQMCMCSYGEHLTLSLTAPYVSTDIQKRFFRILSDMGLDITIHSNQPDEE